MHDVIVRAAENLLKAPNKTFRIVPNTRFEWNFKKVCYSGSTSESYAIKITSP
jgi:hypothetical protein